VELHRVDPGGLSGTSTMESLNGWDAMKLRYADRSWRRCLRSAQVHTDSSSTVLKARRPRPCIFGPRIPEIQIYGVLCGSTA
jgi:hypothetical protein